MTTPSSHIAEKQSSDLETDLTALDFDAPLDLSIFGDHVSQRHRSSACSAATTLRPRRCASCSRSRRRLGRLSDRSGFVGTAEELADLIEELGETPTTTASCSGATCTR